MAGGVTISALPAATTPLAGTELAAIVQAGATKKVAVSNFGSSLSGGTNTQVAVWTGASTLGSFANLTFVNGTKTLAVATAGGGGKFVVDEIDLGATPFVFKDLGSSQVQLGDPALVWDAINGQLNLIPATNVNTALNMRTGGTGGCVITMQDAPGNSFNASASSGGGLSSQSANGNFWQVDIDAGSVSLSGTGVSIINAGFDEFGTSAGDPAAPSAAARLYSKVVGGKQKLYALFPSGVAQLIASEP